MSEGSSKKLTRLAKLIMTLPLLFFVWYWKAYGVVQNGR